MKHGRGAERPENELPGATTPILPRPGDSRLDTRYNVDQVGHGS